MRTVLIFNKKYFGYYALFFFLFFLYSCSETLENSYPNIQAPTPEILKIMSSDTPFEMTSGLEIKFNTKILRSTLYKGISCQSSNQRAFIYLNLYTHDDGDLVHIRPFYPFKPYLKYTCKITKEVTDIYATPLKQDYDYSFKVQASYHTNKTYNPSHYSFQTVHHWIQTRCTHCHNSNHGQNFKTSPFELYETLTNNKNKESQAYYVDPQQVNTSYLLNKLMAIDFYGDKMPPDASIPLYELDAVIGWIKTGANYEEN